MDFDLVQTLASLDAGCWLGLYSCLALFHSHREPVWKNSFDNTCSEYTTLLACYMITCGLRNPKKELVLAGCIEWGWLEQAVHESLKEKKKRTLQPSTVSPSCLIFISDWEHIVVVPIINKRRAHTPSVFCFCGAQFRVNADLFGCSTLKGQCVYLSVWRTASPQNQRQQALPKVRELSIVWIMLFMWKICPWIHNERQTCCLSSLIIIPH